jgi:hypothetical protein
MQYFLTGGAIAALPSTTAIVRGADLKTANRFQRPSILFALAVLFAISFFV